MSAANPIPAGADTPFHLDPVWRIQVELGPEDDDTVRQGLNAAVDLTCGAYDHVSFETAPGVQTFRGHAGTVMGEMADATTRSVRVLSFSIPKQDAVLSTALEAIYRLHSYEEPVIYVAEAYAARAHGRLGDAGSRRWWNR